MSDKTNTLSNSEKSEFAERLAVVLLVQLVASPKRGYGVTKIEDNEGRINQKAIGYIYGFIDCAMQCRGLSITDIDVGLPILYHVIRGLFPGHQQTYIDFLMDNMDNENVVLGMLEGGQEYHDFLHSSVKPIGLAKIILERPS